MKALLLNGYGSTEFLSIGEIEKPLPKENEVLIKVVAAGLNAGDLFSLKGSPWVVKLAVGFPKPKNFILGWDIAGIVEAVGENVTMFQIGDEVYSACESGFAEYARVEESKTAHKPSNLSFEEAAVVSTSALTALQQLRDGCELKPGHKILINGASGGVGSFAVQLAKILGAEVTGVCSTRNVEMVRSLGADDVIDYTKKDFAEQNKRYDRILDNVANRKFSDLRKVLAPAGRIQPNSGHGGMSYVIKSLLLSMLNKQHGKMYVTQSTTEDLTWLKERIEEGKIKVVLDTTYPFEEAAKAFDYMDKEHVRGKVALSIGGKI